MGQILDEGLGTETQILAKGGDPILFRGEFLHQPSPEALGQEVEKVPILGSVRPTGLTFEDGLQLETTVDLLPEGFELARVMRTQATIGEDLESAFGDAVSELPKGVAEHVPAPWCREGFLMFGGLRPEMIRTDLNVFHDPGMDARLGRPVQPVPMTHPQVHMHHSIHQGAGHRFHDGAVLGSVASPDDHRTFWQGILADPSFVDQAVERLLDLMAAGIQFIKKQAIGLLSGDLTWRAEAGYAVLDLGNANEILGCQLAPEHRNAG